MNVRGPGSAAAVTVLLIASNSAAMDCQPYWEAVNARDPAKVVAAASRNGPLTDGEPCVLALQNAVRTDAWDLVVAFLDTGTSANVRAPDGSTPLMWAAAAGRMDVARRLLLAGAGLELSDQFGRTALFYAAEGQSAECVKLLLEAGADVTRRDAMGRSSADAAKYKHFRSKWLGWGLSGSYPTLFDTEARKLLRLAIRKAEK